MNHQQPQLFCRILLIVMSCFPVAGYYSCKENRAASTINIKPAAAIDTSHSSITHLLISQAKKLLKDGALVTRSDNDFESLTLQNFSKRDQSYSHSGLAFLEDGSYMVYHSMTGKENPDGACRRDPFDSFVNPSQKTGFGIFQYQLSGKETEKLHAVMKKNHHSKVPFDVTFNLKSNDSLYCSEMIYKGLIEATGGRVILPSSFINNFKPKIMGYKHNNAFFKSFEYIGIDDLYLNPFCKEIIRVKY